MAEFPWGEETYTESSSGDFIDEKTFNKLVYLDATVQVVAIREGVSTFNNKETPQWLVDFITPEGEEYTKGLAKSNEERNDRMRRLLATLEATNEPIEARFIKVGKRFDIGAPVSA